MKDVKLSQFTIGLYRDISYLRKPLNARKKKDAKLMSDLKNLTLAQLKCIYFKLEFSILFNIGTFTAKDYNNILEQLDRYTERDSTTISSVKVLANDTYVSLYDSTTKMIADRTYLEETTIVSLSKHSLTALFYTVIDFYRSEKISADDYVNFILIFNECFKDIPDIIFTESLCYA